MDLLTVISFIAGSRRASRGSGRGPFPVSFWALRMHGGGGDFVWGAFAPGISEGDVTSAVRPVACLQQGINNGVQRGLAWVTAMDRLSARDRGSSPGAVGADAGVGALVGGGGGESRPHWPLQQRSARPPRPGRSLTKKKEVFLYPGFPKMPRGTPCVGGWRLAVGGWRLAVDGGWWRLMVVGGSWWLGIGG